MQSGEGPKLELKPDQIATLRAGGKSVAELTGRWLFTTHTSSQYNTHDTWT